MASVSNDNVGPLIAYLIPGATALFMMLCGADQNPYPRSKLEYAAKHGADLAAEVDRVLTGRLSPVHGEIRAAFQSVDLEFAIHTRESFESRLKRGPNNTREETISLY